MFFVVVTPESLMQLEHQLCNFVNQDQQFLGKQLHPNEVL